MSAIETATETLQITLPLSLVERIRERVRSGEFSNESEVIAESFSDFSPFNSDGDLDEWIMREAIPALAEHDANPSSAVSLEQMRSALKAHHEEHSHSRQTIQS